MQYVNYNQLSTLRLADSLFFNKRGFYWCSDKYLIRNIATIKHAGIVTRKAFEVNVGNRHNPKIMAAMTPFSLVIPAPSAPSVPPEATA